MSLLNLLFDHKQKSASVAKDRLQLIITHERSDLSNQPDFLPALQYELIDVISKYFSISLDDIKVSLEQQGHYEVLEVNIILPDKAEKLAVKFTGAR